MGLFGSLSPKTPKPQTITYMGLCGSQGTRTSRSPPAAQEEVTASGSAQRAPRGCEKAPLGFRGLGFRGLGFWFGVWGLGVRFLLDGKEA